MSYIQKIENILKQDYDHETPDKPRSKDFNAAIKAFLKKSFPGYSIIASKNAWCQAFGFIKDPNTGKCVYYSFQDYRYGDWKQHILIHTAKDEKDYAGGGNHFTNIDNMYADVMMLM